MNTIAIAIQINQKRVVVGAMWPTSRSIKAMARLKLARFKFKVDGALTRIAMAIIPLPQCPAA